MPVCELCGRIRASCVLGVTDDLQDDDWLRLDVRQVKLSCNQCADTLVSKGRAREMPLEGGDAHDIWYKNCLEITDGKQSIYAGWVPDMRKMA